MRFLSQRGFILIGLSTWLVMAVGILFSLFVLTSCDREPNREKTQLEIAVEQNYKKAEKKPEQQVRNGHEITSRFVFWLRFHRFHRWLFTFNPYRGWDREIIS
jgi:hypothetical protein